MNASKKLGVYAPCPYKMKWVNQQLLKDVCVLPYMFHKEYGYNVTLLSCKNGEYPYLESYLPGMNMEFFPACSNDEELLIHQKEYVDKHYEKMDILVLNAPYPLYFDLVPHYRKKRPDGKIYIGLDANSNWMDRLDWNNENFHVLMNACDVIATSCRSMQHHLSKKWPHWKIEYISNAFFNAEKLPLPASPECKENIILTVGRIGSMQKSNQVMLEAFANASKDLPDWKMRLAGGVDSSFNLYIDDYFKRFPHLSKRVEFLGLVESKKKLYAEYEKARVFCLSSVFEGGAPNVISEALSHGCHIITSKVDAWEDMTGNTSCGSAYPVGKAFELYTLFKTVCGNEELLNKSFYAAQQHAEYNFNWALNIRRIHHLLFKNEKEA